jgi:hypothetical protein
MLIASFGVEIQKAVKVMFRKMLAIIATAVLPVAAFAQGTVNFNTQIIGPTAQVRDGSCKLCAGTNFWAQLYAAPGTTDFESALMPVGSPVNFRTGVNAGYVVTASPVDSVVTITAAAPGGPVTMQMRVWSSYFPTYTDASRLWGQSGKSALLTLGATGNPNGSPPVPPVDLFGLTGFSMEGCIPEPSTLALVLLGGVALLIRRRI